MEERLGPETVKSRFGARLAQPGDVVEQGVSARNHARTYACGVLRIVDGGTDALNALSAQNDLWNSLVAAEVVARRAFREFLHMHCPELKQLEDALLVARKRQVDLLASAARRGLGQRAQNVQQSSPTESGASEVPQPAANAQVPLDGSLVLKVVTAEIAALVKASEKLRRSAIYDSKIAIASMDKAHHDELRNLSQLSGLWWIHAEDVLARFDVARIACARRGAYLWPTKFVGSGNLVVRLSSGGKKLSYQDILDGRSGLVKLVNATEADLGPRALAVKADGGRRMVLSLRVGRPGEDGAVPYLKALITVHREMPANMVVKSVSMKRTAAIGGLGRVRWSALLVLSGPAAPRASAATGHASAAAGALWKGMDRECVVTFGDATLEQPEGNEAPSAQAEVHVATLTYISSWREGKGLGKQSESSASAGVGLPLIEVEHIHQDPRGLAKLVQAKDLLDQVEESSTALRELIIAKLFSKKVVNCAWRRPGRQDTDTPATGPEFFGAMLERPDVYALLRLLMDLSPTVARRLGPVVREEAAAWASGAIRKLEESNSIARRAQARRQHLYRNIASRIADRCHLVVMPKTDFKALTCAPGASQEIRDWIRLAAPGILRDAISSACEKKGVAVVPPPRDLDPSTRPRGRPKQPGGILQTSPSGGPKPERKTVLVQG